MSESKSTIKNFIRTGQFSKRFNVSKPTDMPDIPEEKLVDGRPVSKVDSEKGGKRISTTVSEVRGEKGSNRASNLSNMSNASTIVGHPGLGIHNTPDRNASHTPQPDDLMFIPHDIQTPTTFGPNNEYTAVPTVITYSSSGRGATKITIREANASDPKPPRGYNIPKAMDAPELPQSLPPSYTPTSIPFIAPPPNFTPASGDRVARGVSTFTQGTESIRSSTASSQGTRFSRTSTISEDLNSTTAVSNGGRQPSALDRISQMPSPNAIHGHSLSTSTTPANDEKVISEGGSTHSTHSTLVTPPGSPHLHNGVSWPLTSHGRNLSAGSASLMSDDSPYLDCKEGIPTYPRMMNGSLRSEFQWDLSKKDRARNWFTHWFIEWWLLEIVSWIFSAACMITIAAVLARYDGKPLPRWSIDISINAFISVFSGFAKSALLLPTAEALGQLKWDWFRKAERSMMDFEVMDGASRGALGSAVLLAKNKGVTLASVGAAIILLSLPMDLFFQQIISYPSIAILDISNATISRAITYNPAADYVWSTERQQAQLPPDVQLEAYVYPYWQGSGIIPGVQFDCATGNCTYSPFYSLGLDYQCQELPNFTEFKCQNASSDWMTTRTNWTGTDGNPDVFSCGHFINVPNHKPQLMTGYEVTADGSIGEVLSTRLFPIMDTVTNELFWGGSPTFKSAKNSVADFIIASTPGRFEGAKNNNTPVVSECEVHWVVNKLNATVVSGQLTEHVMETLDFESDLDNPWDPVDGNLYRANFSKTLPDIHSLSGDTSTFGMDNTTAKKVWLLWAEISPSTINLPLVNNPYQEGPVLKSFWASSPDIPLTSVAHQQSPWEFPNNASQHVAEIVTVMNQVVRRNLRSDTNRHEVSVGKAYRYEVLVQIRWQWFSLPLLLLVFSLMFLVATVIRSTKDQDNIGIFKTSALAILFNGLGEDVQERVGAGNRMGLNRERARDMKVHLDDD